MKYLGLILIVLSSSAGGQHTSVIQKVDQLVARTYGDLETATTVLISTKGRIVYEKAFGMANLELAVSAEADHVFQIASMTKQFTAVCILMLMENGELTLSDPVSAYIDDFPDGDQITIHHLLTHTSGISNDITVNPWNQLMLKKDFAPLEFIDYFKREPKVSDPGDAYRYNNFGYVMLGAIIEKVARMKYADFLSKHIFIPLNMTKTNVKEDHILIKGLATGYTKDYGELSPTGYYSPSQAFAAGNIVSTVGDLFKWSQAIQNNLLISEETKKLAFTNHKLNDGSSIGYGYGWFIDDVNGFNSLEHGGGMPGFRSNGIFLPDLEIYVVILTNCDCEDPSYTSKKIAAMVAGRPYDEPQEDFTPDIAELEKWVGKYTFSNGETRNIYLNKDQLYYVLMNGKEVRMRALSNSSFALENTFTRINFELVDDVLVNIYTSNGRSKRVGVKEYIKHRMIELQPEKMSKFVGEYQIFTDFSLVISLKDNQLQSTGTDQEPLNLFPETRTRFFFKSIDAFIDFNLDEEGNCTSLVITQDGKAYSGQKIK